MTSSAAGPLLPSTYLHRDSFEFAVDDVRSNKEREDELYDNERDKSRLRVHSEGLRHKNIKHAIPTKVDEEKGWMDSMRGAKAVGARSRWLPGLEGQVRTAMHHEGWSRSARTDRSQCQRSERQQEQGEVGRA